VQTQSLGEKMCIKWSHQNKHKIIYSIKRGIWLLQDNTCYSHSLWRFCF